ncbi:ADP-ribosylation factor-like protein 13B [Penaeus vannamei]|uniref:ADP-ribosylation factor-like protein 13B n=1 Tax=Penaeus vannamei TaxID=6689 RepID=A0A423TPQ8_PENVA|nr:ADP-ribosylation factor-like protein 13B isoform X5 [Penaeus vannamei]ROT78428.1 ADP-ribosylation factor-like protein 13B [Penaeus vannamei]
MGNCLLLLGFKKQKRPVTLLLVGLDNAGKTTAAKGIVGDPVEDTTPTVGFAPEYLEYRGCEITIYDLGGGSRIRPVWSKYFSEVHGVIFVVDSSDPNRIQECRDVLSNLLSDRKVAGKPVLILANKQDVEGAMDEIDLVESLKIEQVVNKYKCPTRVETCSAITTRKEKPDKPIADGFRWLVDTIVVHYKEINKRVDADMETERKQLEKEMEERRERIRKLRAERERQEALRNQALAARNQVPGVPDSDDSDVVVSDMTQGPGSSGIPNASPERAPSPPSSKSPRISSEVATSPSETSQSSKPHRVILVQESPTHLAASNNNLSVSSPSSTGKQANSKHKQSLSSPSSAEKDKDSRILDPISAAYANVFGISKLDLSIEGRENECVPIDSDDEIFDIPSLSKSGRQSSLPSVTTRTSSTPSIISYIKDHLELEATGKPPKKKSFLKRYHKTAPLVQNNSAEHNSVNHNSRVPPPLA